MAIQSIFVTPGFAVARLGSATAPVDNFHWADVDEPRYDGETTIVPDWSLAVEADASVTPFLPDAVTFRDGERIRPVAPFFEIWARVGAPGSAPESWQDAPLTPTLLAAERLSETDLKVAVNASNRKAARRTGNPDVAFGTAQPVVIEGGDHARKTIEGVSPLGVATPMIPAGRHIPLGSVQMMRTMSQMTAQPWSDAVNIEVFRFRFWPASGLFYGPPQAAVADQNNGRPEAAVPLENAFLDEAAGWFNVATNELVSPGDTYDVINQNTGTTGPSLGVVDDTCEVHFEVTLSRNAPPALSARAVAFVAPPDFAPDRRPFLSVADELNDRTVDWADRNAAMTDEDLDIWIEDFFERVYETVSLFNVDFYRALRAAPRPPQTLPPEKLRAADLDAGQWLQPRRSMGGRDALRNVLYKISRATANNPLPLSEHARMRHRALSDLQNLEALVGLDPDRLSAIIRPPFEAEGFENSNTSSMRMPPFMRQSNALPLTVVGWQYELLMRWLERTKLKLATQKAMEPMVAAADGVRRKALSESALQRRTGVLARLAAVAEHG
ncbi:hypothetical protein [Mesorhizobium sp.]|uniref:hypothetical protein n=1 Tax=Mesorhizobium sp. TaxID=1871066 RepID=UPI00120EB107|nr:hypothetical protein [Mesorhizobium sp.]TIL43284.1 MAG: hypothetical protein E5Y86_22850 [Mesorhizobium sp.]